MSDAVQQIKEKLSILDVISPYVELHKAGKNFKGKSPFSAEKTPSFYVSPDRGMYYCFSTSQGGDMFNFIQAMEGVDFKGALKILADKAGVELIPEDPKKRSERERLFAALEAATVFYSRELEREHEAQAYLEKRGVKIETVAKWRIGYAPGPPNGGWREAKEYLEAKEYSKDELTKAGLIKQTDAGKEPFDVFRDRIVFPMADPSGKVVAFSGRILHPDEKAPKYVNSPETLLYKKSELLYGYDKAKEGIRKLNFSLIVEGQFDVVMCHQAGYNNTVAVSGTALTQHHVHLLERLSDKVVLALDADRAGINAMKKGAEVMLGRGLDVKVAELPLGQDPADLIQANPAEFKQVIGRSVHVIEFLLHVLRREHSDDRSFKLKAQQEIYPFILLLPSRVDQDHFEHVIAEVTKTSKDAVHYEINRLREQKRTQTIAEVSIRTNSTPVESVASETRSVDMSGRAYVYLLAASSVVSEDMRVILERAVADIVTIAQPEEPDPSLLTGIIFRLEQQFADLPALALQEELAAKLNQFKIGLLRQRIQEARHELTRAEAEKDDEIFRTVLSRIAEYETRLREPAYTAAGLFEQKS